MTFLSPTVIPLPSPSYLPLAHIYERFNFTLATHYGCAAGFYRRDSLFPKP